VARAVKRKRRRFNKRRLRKGKTTMITLPKYLSSLAKVGVIALAMAPSALYALTPDLSPEQKSRPRAEKVAEAIAAIPKDFKFANDGAFTVATV
jgi:polar amino acid transport system substrate-binding protein